jgi:hypothetical protein
MRWPLGTAAVMTWLLIAITKALPVIKFHTCSRLAWVVVSEMFLRGMWKSEGIQYDCLP